MNEVATDLPILEVQNIVKHFPFRESGIFGRRLGTVKALNGVSFNLHRGETLAIVGESGCGKSTLAKTLAMLHTPDSGWLWFAGESLLNRDAVKSRAFRRQVQMIFQDPFGSLNPRLTAADIMGEPLVIHKIGNAAERRRKIVAAAAAVGLNSDDLNKYPHQFSGGQRQRIAIARAIISEPTVIIADEPLSALDVSIQSQIINLFMDLKESRNLTYLFISHDLAVVSHFADRVAVMYMGRIIEISSTESLFNAPQHPYTQSLIEASPNINGGKGQIRQIIHGEVASAINPPSGCPFRTRCPKSAEICGIEPPELAPIEANDDDHLVACYNSDTRDLKSYLNPASA